MGIFTRLSRKKLDDQLTTYAEVQATTYQFGNNRFDLATNEQLKTWTYDDLESIRLCLDEFRLAKGNGYADVYAQDMYGRLCELLNRYPYKDFRIEVVQEK